MFCLSGNYGTFVFVVEGTKKFMTNVDMVELQLSHFYYLARVATTGMRALTQAWGDGLARPPNDAVDCLRPQRPFELEVCA